MLIPRVPLLLPPAARWQRRFSLRWDLIDDRLLMQRAKRPQDTGRGDSCWTTIVDRAPNLRMPWLQYAVRLLRPCHQAHLERCSGGLRGRLRRLPASRPGHRSLDNARKCTPAFLLPIDACRTSSSILGGGAPVVTFGLTSSGAGAQSTAVANTVPPDRVDGSLAIGAMAK